MTSIVEQKAKILLNLTNTATGIIFQRVKVVEASEFAEEMKDDPISIGLSDPDDYDIHTKFYANQRAILRGLTAGDVIFHNINPAATYNIALGFTKPSRTNFGYVITDLNGNPLTIADPSLYYLTKKISTDILSSVVLEPNAYATPLNSPLFIENLGVGTVDGAVDVWTTATVYEVGDQILPTVSNGFFYKCIIRGTSQTIEPIFPTTIKDKVSEGNITWEAVGTSITEWAASTIYVVADRVYPATPSGDYFQVTIAGVSASFEPTWSTATNLNDTIIDGGVTWKNIGSLVIAKTLVSGAEPGTLKILHDSVQIGQDDGAGGITGTNIVTGSIDYVTNAISIEYSQPIILGIFIDLQSTGLLAIPEWEALYEQVLFTLGSSVIYGSTSQYTLLIIDLTESVVSTWVASTIYAVGNIVKPSTPNGFHFRVKIIGSDPTSGSTEPSWDISAILATTIEGDITWEAIGLAITIAPNIFQMFDVRIKTSHLLFGRLTAVVEGLELDSSWNKLVDPATDATIVSDSEFRLLLEWMNPTGGDDVVLSADPNNVSTGVKDGGGGYPDIEKNPFYPATDGTYVGNDPFPDSFSHHEDTTGDQILDTFRWQVETGFKFLYEVAPTEAIPPTGLPLRIDPDTFRPALPAITGFSPNGGGGGSLFPLRVPADHATVTLVLVGNYVGWSSLDDWPSSTTPASGDFCKPISGDTGFIFECTTSGAVGASEPTWDRTNGATTSDGAAVWTCRSNVTGELACYYNEVQHLIDDGASSLTSLQTQIDLVGTLGDFENLIEPTRFGGGSGVDPTFFSDTDTFETDLDTFVITDHGTYDPILAANRIGGGGSDYPFAEIETNLNAATTTYLAQFDERQLDLDDVLGRDLTKGIWSPTTVYLEGDEVLPISANGFRFRCIIAGTSASAEPSWDLDQGDNTTDNTVTWRNSGDEDGGYTDTIYGAITSAVNKQIGFIREVLKLTNSIQSIYEQLTNFQEQYSRLP
ncbi:MAG TPA: hypothetical protein ENI23_00600 [bacterium]|nr:hypothetical protein [bacterium]